MKPRQTSLSYKINDSDEETQFEEERLSENSGEANLIINITKRVLKSMYLWLATWNMKSDSTHK